MAPADDLLRQHAARVVGTPPSPGWRVTHLKGDASSRSYHRVSTPEGRSLVLMVMPPEPRSEEATSGAPPPELPFVNVHRYLARLGVRVPRIFAYDPAAQVMVLEAFQARRYCSLHPSLPAPACRSCILTWFD